LDLRESQEQGGRRISGHKREAVTDKVNIWT